MLLVNGKETKITYATLEILKNKNRDEYYGSVKILFELNNKGGYVIFDVDKLDSTDITYFSHKKYDCVPRYEKNTINNLEVYNTMYFYSDDAFINIMQVEFGNITNDEIECKVKINEEYISLDFVDILKLKKS